MQKTLCDIVILQPFYIEKVLFSEGKFYEFFSFIEKEPNCSGMKTSSVELNFVFGLSASIIFIDEFFFENCEIVYPLSIAV